MTISLDNLRYVLADLTALSAEPANVFSVDLEEWYQVGAFENTLKRSDWDTLESRVGLQAEKILKSLNSLGVKATFFCLGWVAERHAGLVQEIAAEGHEIACHGMDHKRLYRMTREEFRADVRKAKDLLENASKVPVIGYRAPSFSLTEEVWWAYEELDDAGFLYSSSLYPVKTDHYGSEQIPKTAFFPLKRAKILEIPMTVYEAALRTLPASGGGYFRLLPYYFSKFMYRGAQKQLRAPLMFYMHPWEVDPDQPYITDAPPLSKFRHYTNQRRMLKKVETLAQDFSWGRLDQVYQPLIGKR